MKITRGLIIRPVNESNEYTTTVRFGEIKYREIWEASSIRKKWVENLNGLVEKKAEVIHDQGIEFWFNSGTTTAAPKWKMAFACLQLLFSSDTFINQRLQVVYIKSGFNNQVDNYKFMYACKYDLVVDAITQ